MILRQGFLEQGGGWGNGRLGTRDKVIAPVAGTAIKAGATGRGVMVPSFQLISGLCSRNHGRPRTRS